MSVERSMEKAVRQSFVRIQDSNDLQKLVEAVGEAKYVLLGEASHGTSEFYTYRAELTKRLIEQKGFRFIAVEGDWPSCYTVNRYIKGFPKSPSTAENALQDFNRWPQWMWANREVQELIRWLQAYNEKQPDPQKAGFYGLDVYSLWESLDEILRYSEQKGGDDLEAAKRAFSCFEPYKRDEQSYGLSAHLFGEGCEEEVVALLMRLQDRWREADEDDREAKLSAELNAMAAQHAEKYYRTMIQGDAESWNVRDRHMVEALHKLMEFHGSGAKVVIWEHNTHIGDARATDMAADGMVNVGQLLREEHGKHVYAIGSGTYEGTVVAGSSWGAPAETMEVPKAWPGSWEDILHQTVQGSCVLYFDETSHPAFQQDTVGHRAIGVVYDPRHERGNYVPTIIGKRYDAFIHIDQTKALTPLANVAVYV